MVSAMDQPQDHAGGRPEHPGEPSGEHSGDRPAEHPARPAPALPAPPPHPAAPCCPASADAGAVEHPGDLPDDEHGRTDGPPGTGPGDSGALPGGDGDFGACSGAGPGRDPGGRSGVESGGAPGRSGSGPGRYPGALPGSGTGRDLGGPPGSGAHLGGPPGVGVHPGDPRDAGLGAVPPGARGGARAAGHPAGHPADRTAGSAAEHAAPQAPSRPGEAPRSAAPPRSAGSPLSGGSPLSADVPPTAGSPGPDGSSPSAGSPPASAPRPPAPHPSGGAPDGAFDEPPGGMPEDPADGSGPGSASPVRPDAGSPVRVGGPSSRPSVPRSPRAFPTPLPLPLLVTLLGCLVLGVVLMLLPAPSGEVGSAAPVPAPGAEAEAAVAAGTPAAPSALTALIGERERHLRARPKDAEAWAVLGAAYVERGLRAARPEDFPRAERALRTALELKRGAPAMAGLAALANARRDFPEARRWAERARKAAPRQGAAYAALIEACTGLGDAKCAGRALERWQELREDPQVRARAAAVYRDLGWREDAAAQVSDAVAAARTPAERAAYAEQAGRLAWERGDLERATGWFRLALGEDREQGAAWAGLARVLAAQGRPKEAARAWGRALALRPDPEYALELGEWEEARGRVGEARAAYARMREGVRRAEAHGVNGGLLLGRYEADHGDPETAVRLLREEWRRQPSTEAADALGWALHRAGRAREALGYAVRATDSARGGGVRSALFAYHRALIERELGRTGAARRHLREALVVNPRFSPLRSPLAQAALRDLGEPDVHDLPEDVTPPEGGASA